MYRIKPLDWKKHILKDKDGIIITYEAHTRFGNFEVTLESDFRYQSRGLYWNHCFDEYYEQSSTDCKSIKAGIAAAEEYWVSILKENLEEI